MSVPTDQPTGWSAGIYNTPPGQLNRPYGIDVSDHNDLTNWQLFKAHGGVIAFIKATQAMLFVARTFPANWAGAKAAGLFRSSYHFFEWGVDAVKQAEHFASVINHYDPGELPPTVDIEGPGDGAGPFNITKAEAVRRIGVFLDTVKLRTGRSCILYTYPSVWRDLLGNPKVFADHPLWIASYSRVAQKPSVPGGWKDWKFWQYSDAGKVPGNPHVDLDVFNGSLEELRRFSMNMPTPTPQPTVDPAGFHTPAGCPFPTKIGGAIGQFWEGNLNRLRDYGWPIENETPRVLEDGKTYTTQLFQKVMLHWDAFNGVQVANLGAMYQGK